MRRALAATVLAALLTLGVVGARSEPPGGNAPASQAPEAAAPPNPAPAPPPEAKPEPEPKPPQNLEEIDAGATVAILGKKVRDASGKDMGLVVEVLVDRDANVRAAVIDFGGFLGVGSRKIAVDWNALHFPQPGKPNERIALELTRDQVKSAPEYQDGRPVVILGALGKLEPLPE
jgi:hypothetical protein